MAANKSDTEARLTNASPDAESLKGSTQPTSSSSPVAQGEDHSETLKKLLDYLANQVRQEQLETWFRSLLVLRVSDDEIELSVTSQFVRDWLAKNYLTELQTAVDSATSADRRRLVLTYRAEDGQDSLRLIQPSPAAEVDRLMQAGEVARSEALRHDGGRLAGHGTSTRTVDGTPTPPITRTSANAPATGSGRRIGNPLNPNYTFDKFVVGPCNRLAHASALAIGENPGHAYNPLFVHGNVGLGKTHLLQAICHTVLRRDPGARVLYMSCEDFTNSYIQAIQAHAIDSFRDYHRGADVLVIDDVQFLANKEKTQDEFFHTFNALFDGQRQIVLSSDRPPVEIPTIEERLVSRFKWGLVAEVEAPCVDTRKAIVNQKAAGRGVDLPDDVAQFLAERVSSNIRELEGAVIKVVGFAAITDQPITLSLAESCLRGMPMRRAQVTAEEIMSLITGDFAITARELIGKSRTQSVSLPRQIAMYLLREHTENSLEDIGKIFGNRDHTTVIYAVNKIRERSQKDRMFKETLDNLSSRLMTRSFRS
ncbi:MAG: chromosomal replication initiator protein DnaA [Planctomycetes bacterium]|nr:chromosomal replication initiator protein DnaA [Planctomycetota bacterium]